MFSQPAEGVDSGDITVPELSQHYR